MTDQVDPFEFEDDLPAIPDDEEDTDYLADLVGEGRKYESVEAAARALAKKAVHADMTIEALKQKADNLRQEVNTRTSLDQFLTKMTAPKEPERPADHVDTPSTPNPASDIDLDQKLEEFLARKEQEKLVETNKAKVARVLNETLGAKASAAIRHKATELNMSVQDLQSFAHRSPDAFFKLMDVEPGSATPPPQGAVPTSRHNQHAPVGATVRGNSYYEKLKQSNPAVYWDPKTTTQMIKDMTALGREKYYLS